MRSRVERDNQQSPVTGETARVNRRGSALVLVVGTLALIAVFAALYVTLGQADTRVSRGVEQGGAIEDVERQVADYIADIVGRDRLAASVETVTIDETAVGPRFDANNAPLRTPNSGDRQRFVREATDFPYTDYSRLSIITNEPGLAYDQNALNAYANKPALSAVGVNDAVAKFRFDPAGDVLVKLDQTGLLDTVNIGPGNPNMLLDRRIASDPWLAYSEPTFTGRIEAAELRGGNAFDPDNRVYSLNAANTSGQLPQELFYLDNRDWAQISNLAPNGLSVNLFNLRNNFDAESGLGLDAAGRPRTGENRTLLTITPSAIGTIPQLGLRATDRLHIDPFGGLGTASILGTNPQNPNADPRTFAIKNTPAWWTMNQRFLYFPTDPSFQILGRGVDANGFPLNTAFNIPQTPAHPDFPDYQYADADGDGFYDSRWFELVDSTLGPTGVQNLLSNETDMRFFVAARVIDLSGRVNVNSATDGLVPSTNRVPAGATPAEIDLRRLLTMEDVSERYRPVFPNTTGVIGGSGIQQLSYANIQRLPLAESQAVNTARIVPADYERYAAEGVDIGLPNAMLRLDGPSILTGRYAYDAIRRAIQGDEINLSPLATNQRANPLGVGSPVQMYQSTPFEFYDFDPTNGVQNRTRRTGPAQAALTTASELQISRMPEYRRDYWFNVGGSNIADPGDPPITADGFGGNLFGLEDLSDLLVFGGMNDDRVLSRLERVTQSRFEGPGTPTTGLGPLRATRPTALERGFHDDRFNLVNPNGTPGGLGDNLIDFESMALLALNTRLRLTTLSGASPIRSRAINDANGDGFLSPEERRLTSEDARLDLTASPSAPELFTLYTDALIPYAFVDATWGNDPSGEFTTVTNLAQYNQLRTLAYGHRGSELALRISAHLSANMADLLDADDVPSAMTVLAGGTNSTAGQGPRDLLETQYTQTAGMNSPYPWWSQDDRLDMGDDRLAGDAAELANPSNPIDFSRQAYNVYGLEPQPFVTEVAVVTVYSDVPRAVVASSPVPGEYTQFDTGDLAETEAVGLTGLEGTPSGLPLENPSLNFDGDPISCGPGETGGDDGTLDDVTLRVDIAPTNPDLMLHLLAVQITNPFDVPINLTDDEEPFETPGLNAGPGGYTDNDGSPLMPATQLNDIKYYIEFNGHFFALADFVEDPLLIPQLPGSAPQVANGLHRVVLQPGESRVFYVSAHPNLTSLTTRWQQVDAAYGSFLGIGDGFNSALNDGPPLVTLSGDPDFVQRFIHDQLAVRRTARDIDPLMGDDVSFPARMVPFNPVTGDILPMGTGTQNMAEGPGGGFVDFMRTNNQFRQYATKQEYDRLRQEVRLWRKMTVDNPNNAIGALEGDDFLTGDNWLGNDLLVDRLRDPALQATTSVSPEAALDYALMNPEVVQARPLTQFGSPFQGAIDWDTQIDERQIPLTVATDDTVGAWNAFGGTNQGLTIVKHAGYRRPDHLAEDPGDSVLNDDGLTPRGLLPAWCIEGNETNFNIVQPTLDDGQTGIAGLLDIHRLSDISAGGPAEFMGEYFGFRGCQSPTPGDDTDTGGMFFMNFRRFMQETAPVRLNAADPDGPILQNLGLNGVQKFDPMIVPTITRHPAVKFRRVEIVNVNPTGTGPYDFDGDGRPDDFADPLGMRDLFRNDARLNNLEYEITDKRTMAQLGENPEDADAALFGSLPTLLSLGRDGIGEANDPRESVVRLGDLALPFGVGATFAPINPTILPQNFQPGDWTTFAEAMSAAMGYEPIEFYNRDPGQPGWSLLSELVDAKGTTIAPLGADSLMATTQPYQQFFVLDRGRLDLNGFAPFVNLNALAELPAQTEPQFNPAAGDYRVAFSEPPAQRLLSMGRALNRGGDPLTTPVIGTININTASDAVLRTIPGFATPVQFSEAPIDYDRYTPNGVVPTPTPNAALMDWAPGRVAAKTVNGFLGIAPPAGQPYRPMFGIGDPFGDLLDIGGGFGTTFVNGWKNVGDVPSALIAFRDRTRGVFRRASKDSSGFAGGGGGAVPIVAGRNPEDVFDFEPSTIIGLEFPNRIFAPDILSLTVNNYATDFSRSAVNGQGASTEAPGMSGVGSLMGLTVARFDPLASMPQTIANPRIRSEASTTNWRTSLREIVGQATMTRHAQDGLVMAAVDQDLNGNADTNLVTPGEEVILNPNEAGSQIEDNFSFTLGRGGYFNENPDLNDRRATLEDEVLDDMLEELAIFNGAANTVDVRSDFFAAWYLVRGYRQQDVESLSPNQPMRPTYQKRFLMILDRSNVTDAGQMPRVLMMREVPL